MSNSDSKKLNRRDMMKAVGATAGAVSLDLSSQQKSQGKTDKTPVAAAAAAISAQGTDQTAQVPSVADGEHLTTNQGLRVSDDQNSLRAGSRGPTLIEDFHFREKITHFDHERIPERVVHARGSGAHGVFQVYDDSMAQYTKASFLRDPSIQTPVFVRFSTVNGSRGSADTVRDARGFATKFYTNEGVFDLVGNNIPVFFIQDAIKFPDLVHAFKPEPDNEIPQASTAHDTFWDFIGLTPESMHMIMWVMSDRAIPRSYRMMEGFGVHTFRLVNDEGVSTFVKFHWKPLLGVHSLAWDEAQKLAGKDPDYHRRDLWDAIAAGAYPEYELGVQLVAEEDELSFDFDLLDATKIIPEDLVPVQRIGKLTLNQNPENFFAETEQVAFHLGHIVPGIDFSNDPLLQGRLFSYLDTQINRFGGPNFHQLPINQPRAAVNNYQQDSFMRYNNRPGKVNYEPNSLGGNAKQAPAAEGGYVSYPAPVEGLKVRERSETFGDHFSQATLFYNSMSDPEKEHIIQALQFELGKVTVKAVQQRMVDLLGNVDTDLTSAVGNYLGLTVSADSQPSTDVGTATGLSQEETVKDSVVSRKIAILATDGATGAEITQMQTALTDAGASSEIVATHLGAIQSAEGEAVPVTKSLLTTASVMYDAVYVPGGAESVNALKANGDALHFVQEAYKHAKPLAATAEGAELLTTALGEATAEPGIVSGEIGATSQSFIDAIAQHRFWTRQKAAQVPA